MPAKSNKKLPKQRRAKKRNNKSAIIRLAGGMRTWLTNHARLVTILAGSSIVTLWTLIRHITNGVNFDVVGQIGVAQQWMHGSMSGTQLGATNYLLKIPFYILMNGLSFISPMNRILLVAILFNVVVYVLLLIICERIIQLYKIKHRGWLYLGMLWLATIAGNVFWVDYANSRNLETVGGLLFIYLALKFFKEKGRNTLIELIFVGSIVFFADPMQLYVCGFGVCVFMAGYIIFGHNKAAQKPALMIIGATITGYVFSLVLLLIAKGLLSVSFLPAPHSQSSLSIVGALDTLSGLVKSTLDIFGADFLKRPYTINSIRELLNAIVVVLLVIAIAKAPKKVRKYTAFRLILVVIAINYLVYIASGQVLQWETSRYLVMVPLFTLLLLAIRADRLGGKNKQKLQYAWLLAISLSAVMLLGALVTSWPNRHSKDTHISNLVSFMGQQHFKYAMSSRDVGITTTYFSNGKSVVLPMACDSNRTLHPTNLFYDNSEFKGLYDYSEEVPVLVPEGGIRFGENICTVKNVISQFGLPNRELSIPGWGVAEIYNASQLHMDEIDALVGYSSNTKLLRTLRNNHQVNQSSTLAKLIGCDNGTIDVIVAHPDDDILFMNPDLSKQLTTKCVRSIYITAGDDGRKRGYWMNRQRGIEAAYASMLGLPDDWNDVSAIINGHTVATRSLNGHSEVGLIFLRLPDGGTSGQGFPQTGYTSLEKMFSNNTAVARTVDESSTYTYIELVKLISTIISTDRPRNIYTLLSSGQLTIGDHSDHKLAGQLAVQARVIAKSGARISKFVGYPLNQLPSNLSPEDTTAKTSVFNVYASQDSTICISTIGCSIDETYGKYFSRSYKIEQNQR